MKTNYFSVSLIIGLLLSSCAIAPTHGLLVTKTEFAGEFNPENNVSSIRSGEGCQISFVGLVSFGKAGAGDIAREFGIQKISTVDHSFFGILYPTFGRFCTRVEGE
jgi:hypothetical protein